MSLFFILILLFQEIGLDDPNYYPGKENEKPEDWKEFYSPKGMFTIEFPAEPEVEVRKIPDVQGDSTDLVIYNLEKGIKFMNSAYSVSFETLKNPVYLPGMKQSDIRERMDTIQNRSLRALGGDLLFARDIDYKGFPGRHIYMNYKNVVFVSGRIYLVGTRIYRLQVITPVEWMDNQYISKFLDSFRLDSAIVAEHEKLISSQKKK